MAKKKTSTKNQKEYWVFNNQEKDVIMDDLTDLIIRLNGQLSERHLDQLHGVINRLSEYRTLWVQDQELIIALQRKAGLAPIEPTVAAEEAFVKRLIKQHEGINFKSIGTEWKPKGSSLQ